MGNTLAGNGTSSQGIYGRSEGTEVTTVENEVALRFPNHADLVQGCVALQRLQVPLLAITPEGAPTAYIWVQDNGQRVANLVHSHLIGPQVEVVHGISKGRRHIMSPNPMTYFNMSNWHEELRRHGFQIVSCSPPSDLNGSKFVNLA